MVASVSDTRPSWATRLRTATSERALADYWTAYVDSGRGRAGFALRHPRLTATALVAILRLPLHRASLSDDVGGRAVAAVLTRPGLLGTSFAATGAAVLAIPDDPDEHLVGRSRQTLRRKIRAAQKKGIVTRLVHDPVERTVLLETANAAEMAHRDATYRVARPDNADLLDHDLWLVADDQSGRPLLLSVTPTDGEWATLRYFRTLGAGDAHSDSRYLATQALLETLSARGVRHLLDTEHPGAQPNGLRHFQRMVGFRYARVRMAA